MIAIGSMSCFACPLITTSTFNQNDRTPTEREPRGLHKTCVMLLRIPSSSPASFSSSRKSWVHARSAVLPFPCVVVQPREKSLRRALVPSWVFFSGPFPERRTPQRCRPRRAKNYHRLLVSQPGLRQILRFSGTLCFCRMHPFGLFGERWILSRARVGVVGPWTALHLGATPK
jgi:hypothetical protein